jgi:hypothetical protein
LRRRPRREWPLVQKLVSVSNDPTVNAIAVNKDQLLRSEHRHICTTNDQIRDE